MLRQRILTAVMGLPIFIAAIWFGNPWFTILIAIVAIFAGIEFYRIAIKQTKNSFIYFALIVILLLILSPFYPDFFSRTIIITVALIISLVWLLFLNEQCRNFSYWAFWTVGILYIGWMLSYWVELRNLAYGRELILWSVIIVMLNDTGAFFLGRQYGRHFMAPSISPKKTWEGAISGLIISMLISVILGRILSLPFNYWHFVLFGIGISVFAQLGDLVESLLKRNAGIKDSSQLIPGHGGMFDRIDSYIFLGAAIYLCAAHFLG